MYCSSNRMDWYDRHNSVDGYEMYYSLCMVRWTGMTCTIAYDKVDWYEMYSSQW